jgi:hypothetical protein
VEAAEAGRVQLQLPGFPPGKYRFNVHLHRSRSPGIVRLLTVGPDEGADRSPPVQRRG